MCEWASAQCHLVFDFLLIFSFVYFFAAAALFHTMAAPGQNNEVA